MLCNTDNADCISIHAPRERSDDTLGAIVAEALSFQSTLPVKGATCAGNTGNNLTEFQSTLPVKGATIVAD